MSPSTPSGWQQAMPALYGRILIILVAVLLAGYALRIFRLDSQSLWYDEGYSLEMAQQDLLSLTRTTAEDIHPPLYYYLLKAWITFVGTTEFSMRYLSLIFGMLIVPASYVVARSLFLGKPVALAAAALAAFSPLYIHYSQEVRMYTLMGLSSQLAAYCFLNGASTGRRRSWVGYAAFMVLALYSHLYAALIFAFLNLAFIFLAMLAATFRKAYKVGTDIRSYVLSQAAVAILFAPWLQVAFEKFASYTSPARGSALDWILEQTAIVFSLGHSVLSITSFPGQPGFEQDLSLALVLSMPFVAVATLGTAVVLSGRQSWASTFSPPSTTLPLRTRAIFSIAYLILPLCLIVLLSLGRRDFNARYLFAASPAYYLLIAAGMVALTRFWRGRWFLALTALVFVGVWSYALDNYYFVEKYSRDDHRSAVDYIRRHSLAEDIVVLDGNFYPVYKYYAGDELNWIQLPQSVPPDDQQTLAILAKVAPSYQRVWLIMWGNYFLDPERIVQRWLDVNAFKIDSIAFHGPIIVYGYLTTSPILDVPAQPSVPMRVDFADQISLLGYDVRTEEGQSGRRIHLTLYWQAQKKIPVNYSIFAHLLNSAGQMLGIGDSQPVNGRLPTTTWEPGQTIRSELDVGVLPAVPPGDYRLLVGVYDQTTMRRLETSRGNAVDLGPVRLSKRTVDTKGLDYRQATAVQYGDIIQLIGYRIDKPTRESLSVTLFWRAQQKPPRRYTVFNHLVDSSGRIVAQKDGEPGGGSYPTDRWEPGEVIRDEYDIPLPASLGGDYRLLTGLYAPETNERLTIHDWWPFGKRDDAYDLGKVHITP